MDTAEAGKRGGKASAAKLTKKERKEKARTASQERWRRYYAQNPGKVNGK